MQAAKKNTALPQPGTSPMLRSLTDMHGYRVRATDKDLGKLRDTYFEDRNWIIQYFVVDTGRWLPGRKVLLSPSAVGRPDGESRVVPTELSSDKVESSPEADRVSPISQEYLSRLNQHYGWPMRWDGVPLPLTIPPKPPAAAEGVDPDEIESSGLRSAEEVTRYGVRATDGDIGHVQDFIVEEGAWAIRYLVIDTNKWLPGRRKVLVSPRWIRDIDWAARRVSVDLERERIKKSPEFDPAAPVNREYELRLYDYYGRPRYWASEES